MTEGAGPKRPVLRYPGGKWRLGPWVISHFPGHRIYVEPYGGAGSVLLRKPRSYAEIWNDLDGEVVGLFRVLQDRRQAEDLQRLLHLTPFARAEFDLAYEATDDPVEQARRLIVRSFMGHGATGYNSIHRTGFRSKCLRSRTCPATRDWVNYPAHMDALTKRMRGVLLECRPALRVMQAADRPDALHYVDPPYPHGTRSALRWPSDGKRFYRHEMTDGDHRDMAGVLRELQGMVVLSGYPCPLYDEELFPDWHRVERLARADGGKERTEVLWLSPRTWEALRAEGKVG